MIEHDLAAGRVKPLLLKAQGGHPFGPPIDPYPGHERGRRPGRDGRWFVEALRKRLASDYFGVDTPPFRRNAVAIETHG